MYFKKRVLHQRFNLFGGPWHHKVKNPAFTATIYMFFERAGGDNVSYNLLDTWMYQITSLKPRITLKQCLHDGLRLFFMLLGC